VTRDEVARSGLLVGGARVICREVTRRTLTRAIWTLAVALIVILFLKTFVADVKHVDSGSMEPTIFGMEDGGESVLVLYDRSPPKRFDLVVILRQGETTPIVKRVTGLAGETVQVSNGDILVDNHRLAASEPRPPPVVVFDDRWQSVEDAFHMGAQKGNPWTKRGVQWELDASAIGSGEQAGLMYLGANVDDDYLAPDHRLVRGSMPVNDVIVECEALAREPGGHVRFMLSEQGDTFHVAIQPGDRGDATLRLTRLGEHEEEMATGSAPFALNAWHRVRFANVDNALTLVLDGVDVLHASYKENRFHPHDTAREGKSFPHRVYLGGDGGKFGFRAIRVLRDLYYTQRGHFGVDAPAELGPGEYFVLGDNSADSRDSREWGPVHASEIVGRAIWVIWPPGHARHLVATVPPPPAAGAPTAVGR
jgi:signal peptidase I